jgi:MFS family permease
MHRRYYIFGLLFFLSMITYFDRVMLSIVMPALSKDFSLGPVAEGYLLSAFFWIYIVLQIPAGMTLDRFGTRQVLAIAVTIWSLATGLTALATSYLGVFLGRLMLGVGEAPSYPSGIRSIRAWAPHRERALATAIFSCGATLGSAFSAILIGWVVSVAGWRAAFAVSGAIGLIWVVAWLLMFRDPSETRWLREPERRMILAERSPGGTEGVGLSIVQLARYRTMWGMLIVMGCLNYANYVALGWLPAYLVRSRNMDLLHSSYNFAFVYICAGLLTLGLGRLSDRALAGRPASTGTRRYGVVLCSIVASSVLLVPFLSSMTMVLIVLTIATTGMQSAFTNLYSQLNDVVIAGGGIGKAVSFLQLGGNLFGVCAPIVTGYLVAETGSFTSAFVFDGILVMIGAVVSLTLTGRPVGTPGHAREARASDLVLQHSGH